jgi:CHASE3 domain sensor protein
MSRLPLRLLLLIAVMAAVSGAGYFLWSSTRAANADAALFRTFNSNGREARTSLADLRAAQQSYVAAGQGEDFWFGRVTEIANDLENRLSVLRGAARTPDAVAEVETATTALHEFMQMDARARDYTRRRQLTLASDMIFADGFELARKASDAVERALTAERVTRDAGDAAVQRQQAIALAGCAGITLLSVLLLIPVPRRAESVAAAVASLAPPVKAASTTLALNDVKFAPKPPAKPVAPLVDLDRLAGVCADLARVPDTRALPALLERTAGVLEASGIVLWIADPDGRELAPILVHGYPPQLAGRLGTIARDAGNVTAAAYRTGLLQTMKADAVSSGAIAVPLVAPIGCVGVMAAEMKNGGEQREPLLAAAGIIAAQLATLVGPPSMRNKAEAAS